MKLIKLLSVTAMMMAMASCSSDSNDDEPVNLATEANGTYSGYTVASCTYFSDMVADDQSVTLSTSELNTVNISYVSDTWGTFTINNATLTGSAGNITIKGTGTSLMGHAGSEASEYDCTVEGTLIGQTLKLTFSLPTVMGGLKIEFNEGDVPASLVVPGTYSGYVEASSAYFSGKKEDDQTIVIALNSDNTFKITYTSDTFGDFTIDNATATYSDGKFSISGSGTTVMGMNGNSSEYDCTIAGTIDVSKEDPTFTFTVPVPMGGMTIVFHSGDMPDDDDAE